MSERRFGFDRTHVHSSVCEELASLSRLKLEEAIVKTEREDNEVVFGALITNDRVEYTEFYSGSRKTVEQRDMFRMHNEMIAIDPEGDRRLECLLHTHPGEAFPSLTDLGVILSALKLGDTTITRGDVPEFDQFYIVSRTGESKGKIRGYIIEDRPTRSQFSKIATRYKQVQEDMRKRSVDEKKEYINNTIDGLSQYISECTATFKLTRKQPGFTEE